MASILLNINGQPIKSKKEISVLGIIFDSKLQWGPQVANAITKSARALNAISLIRNYFNQEELLKLVTSNYYSILFYNSEIWHLPSLKQSLKNSLLSASARALKLCAKSVDLWMLSFAHLHEMVGRATPNQMMTYKLALQLYKTFNYRCPTMDWVSLNFNQIMGTRQKKFSINMTNSKKVGMNALSNRLWYLNGKIDTDWLNHSFDTFKVNCKKLLLQ